MIPAVRSLHLTAVEADGQEIHHTISMFIAHGKLSWLLDGEPLFDTTHPALIVRGTHIVDALLGASVERLPTFKETAQGVGAISGEARTV